MNKYCLIAIIIILSSCNGFKGNNTSVSEAGVDTDEKLINYNISLSNLIDTVKIDKRKIGIVVSKSKYRLYVMVDTIILKSYPVVFGRNPVNDKLQEGDRCTPEGEFAITSKYPHKKWIYFIRIDYPNKSSYEKFEKAKNEGRILKSAKIGGDIGIHGVPYGADFAIDQRQNWTLGCISMKNLDVSEIYDFVSAETTVKIEK